MSPLRRALVGAFVLGGLLLFGAGLFMIGDRRLLFVRQFELNATFGKVTGLQVGTRVRLAGLDAGEVLEIRIPSRPSDRFLVRLRVREDLRPLVRADSACAIQTDGIVGNAFVQLSVGTDDAPLAEPGDTLACTDPIEFADLIQEGRDTFRTVTREVLDLKEDLSVAVGSLTQTIDTANGVIAGVGANVSRLTMASTEAVEAGRQTLADARAFIDGVRSGRGTIGQLLTDDTLYQRMAGVAREGELTMQHLREATEQARIAIDGFVSRDGTASQIAQALRNTLADVQEVTSDLAEGTEALKRNFLFRGFFRDRGFYDLNTLSREAYQAGALEQNQRTALRVWVESAMLFATDADGNERLTDEGRRRIDSVMADFVRYPRDSPLVVEGYALSLEGEAAYLRSADRAQLVREYLLSRFRRQTTLTGTMPMGEDATGSPRGDGRWSGVALTLFVRNEQLSPARAATR